MGQCNIRTTHKGYKMAAVLRLFVSLLMVATTAFCYELPLADDSGSFWYGTQNLGCMVAKGGTVKVKRSATEQFEAIERSTIEYAHRMIYYKGQIFEWGAGTKGYHFGPSPSIPDCDIVWEEAPAGQSDCDVSVLETFTRGYRARYGGYNLVTNNCHHYANRIVNLLLADTCSIGEDRWVRFNRKFGVFMKQFMKVFRPGSDEHPAAGEQEGNPHNANDWPIFRWYKK